MDAGYAQGVDLMSADAHNRVGFDRQKGGLVEAGTPSTQHLRDAEAAVGKLWWLWLVAGIAWVIIALVILQFDDASVRTVGTLIGLMFLLSGIQQFTLGGMTPHGGWIFYLFGILLIVAGIIALIEPEETFAGIADILGFLFLLVGVFWIVGAFMARELNELWWVGLVAGILMVILAFWTGGQFFIEKQYVLLVFAGIWALMHGMTDIVNAFAIRRLGKEARG